MNPAASPSQTFHVWFSTKGRKPVLHEEIRDMVLDKFHTVASERSVRILALEAVEDHVHILLQLRPNQELSNVMHDLKGASARAVFKAYPELKLDVHSHSLGQKSYGSRLVPMNQVSALARYIRTQEDRPLRHE